MSISLDKFRHGNVLHGALGLFESLGIKLNTPSERPVNLRHMIPDPGKALSDVLDKIDKTYFVGTIDDKALHGEDESLSLHDEIIRIDEHYKGMMVFAVEVNEDANITRTDIATLTRALNRMSKAAPVALVVRYGDKISFSICERTAYRQGGHTGEKAGRVSILRDIDIENTHRGHIDILEMMRAGGITTFDDLYAKWLDVFSSDTLTKRFYQELSNWYALAIQVIRFPNDLTTTADDQKFNHEGAIRLITRLIFVWFLKQRNLIPTEFFDPDFVGERLLKDFNPHEPTGLFRESARNSHYYRGILQNLFFATLNCPLTREGSKELTERRFKDGRSQYNVNNLMRYRDLFRDPDLFIEMCNTVPFLNGGLFDCLDEKGIGGMYYDGFSERQESIAQLCVPDYLFFSDNIKADLSGFYDDKKQKNVTVRGLIDIFNRYQFTVEENTPLDQEVALDPELLGKVFENLLASFNPETKTTARKQTGSFYTPREIVQYMVDESLVAHLKKVVDPGLEPEFRKLLSYSDEPVDLSDEQKKAIMQGLYNCRILDPACGSGAFPMGILQQMVHILTKIDPDNSQWKDMLLDIAIKETSDAYRTSSDADRQEAILDIEKSFNAKMNRPDYARKLYLIENCIYGVDIQPIAIQISKLRFFISLVIDQITNDDPADNYGIRPLPNLEAKFVAANSLRSISREMSLGDTEEVKALKDELKRLNHKIFSDRSWSSKKRTKIKIMEARQKLAEELASIGMFSESESQAIASWDMFDQNHHADFFDPEWMFGTKDGFDIVIGNPPYVDYRKIDNETKEALIDYKSYKETKTGSLYVYFIERGMSLLKDNSYLVYINPYQFLSADSGFGIRKLIFNNYRIEKLVDVSHIRVFEAASTYTSINVISKTTCFKSFLLFSPITTSFLEVNPTEVKVDNVRSDIKLRMLLSGNTLLDKIESKGQPLGVCCKIFCGLSASGFRNYVIHSDTRPSSQYLPFFEAKNILKYQLVSDKFIDKSIYTANPLKAFKQQCIFWARMTTSIRVALSEPGYAAGKVNVLHSFKYDPYSFCALLNSKLLNYYYVIKNESKHMNGGAFNFDTPSIKELPIANITSISHHLSALCKQIMEDKEANLNTDALENQIDILVYHLYGLTYDEVLVVDPEPPFSREEYENAQN